MKTLTKTFLAATGLLALSASGSSAAVVCNESGDCWRVRGKPTYSPELRLQIHEDNWRWKRGEKYRWRKHGHGHGYYRDGAWITIRP